MINLFRLYPLLYFFIAFVFTMFVIPVTRVSLIDAWKKGNSYSPTRKFVFSSLFLAFLGIGAYLALIGSEITQPAKEPILASTQQFTYELESIESTIGPLPENTRNILLEKFEFAYYIMNNFGDSSEALKKFNELNPFNLTTPDANGSEVLLSLQFALVKNNLAIISLEINPANCKDIYALLDDAIEIVQTRDRRLEEFLYENRLRVKDSCQ